MQYTDEQLRIIKAIKKWYFKSIEQVFTFAGHAGAKNFWIVYISY